MSKKRPALETRSVVLKLTETEFRQLKKTVSILKRIDFRRSTIVLKPTKRRPAIKAGGASRPAASTRSRRRPA